MRPGEPLGTASGMTPLKVVLCGTGWPDFADRLKVALRAKDLRADVIQRAPGAPLAPLLADADVVLPSNALFGAAELDAAPRVRLLQQPAVGHEGIDKAAARARGVPVCNAPGTNADAVAQLALLLLLSLARRLPIAQRRFREAAFGGPVGVELSGRTLGIVGRGRSGERLAIAAEALGMRVLSVTSKGGRPALLSLLRASDAVSLHCPLDASTRGMIDDEALSAMRPAAFLVNVARGGIVDRDALTRALDAGRLGGVGLDVFWEEPWDPHDPLFARDDVVTLPHVGGATEEAFDRIARIAADNIAAIRTGAPLVHRVDG